MPNKKRFSGSAGLVVAALLTGGLAATPFTLSPVNGVTTNAAMAGTAREYMPGGTADMPDIYDSPLSTLGVTSRDASWHQTKVASRQLADYKRALRSGELARAADDLAAVSRRPITDKLVTDLNTQLGVQTPLADVQIAAAAAARQKSVS